MKKTIISALTALLLVVLSVLFPELELFSEIPAELPAETAATVPVSGNGMTVHFLDVGQADCALLECDGEYMVIDGGNVEDGQMVVSYFKQMGIEKLSAVVCTHAHEDHVGGLPAVLSVFEADTVYSPVTEYSSKVFRDFVSKTEAQGLSLTVPKPGDRFMLGSASVTVLGPVKEYEDPNNTSIVLKVSYGDSDFLFTGDMETLAENDMMDHWGETFNWDMEVLKVGHHGSDTSTGYRMLYYTSPEQGVISVGEDNKYGHPNDAPLSKLKDAEVLVFRTDKLGHVIATTDGSEISFTWENQKAAPEDVEPADGKAIFFGNRKSKTFHDALCQNLPKKNNREDFTNYGEAIAAGYKPCGSCIN